MKKPKTLQEKLADSHYQPTKAEMEQEYDMPGADMNDLRDAFFSAHHKLSGIRNDQAKCYFEI